VTRDSGRNLSAHRRPFDANGERHRLMLVATSRYWPDVKPACTKASRSSSRNPAP
jgi:hypothetical protein